MKILTTKEKKVYCRTHGWLSETKYFFLGIHLWTENYYHWSNPNHDMNL